jgi:Protein of unknown function (DUF4232)
MELVGQRPRTKRAGLSASPLTVIRLAASSALMVGTLLATSASSAAPTVAATTRAFCALDTGLKATMRAAGVAAGTAYLRIILVNSGSRTCIVQGVPGVQPVVGLSHEHIGPSSLKLVPQLGRGGRVTLAPTGTADVVYGVETAVNWPKAKCAPKLSNGVLLHFEGVRDFFVENYSKGGGGRWLVCTRLSSTSIYGVKSGQGSA